ncbi:capsular biosynthesis protein [Pokkaliibacter plantistimulans]|uniref:protein-tyrosine-phosphatase n=1 Tax=Proteobacteria bacterium 228 TaxID=2083153 RepID=A0A2S5KK21_9PROT|nr:CpsB/CapC family capsule biosynthesis tyrosine phosphatase [Pokkaliibacter plantistimulans]PPC74963.1 capsular biosynthesis protein [Pokkaliibacter plantistimulans]
MIDLHSHLLPGIDDGAQTMDDSLELAYCAVRSGTTALVVTPHFHPGRYDNSLDTVEPVFRKFSEALVAEKIPLKIYLGAEVRLSVELMSMLASEKIPMPCRWEGKKVLLLELPHSHIPAGSEQLVKWLINKNVIPMVAHPERNKEIMADPSRLAPLVMQGCLLQITASAVHGGFGAGAQRLSNWLIEQDLATVIASDGHNMRARPPTMLEGYEYLRGVYGETVANKLSIDTPKMLLNIC